MRINNSPELNLITLKLNKIKQSEGYTVEQFSRGFQLQKGDESKL